MLYATPVDDSMEMLPSPEALKNKIIIKAKKPSVACDGEPEENYSSDDDDGRNSSDNDNSDDTSGQTKNSKNTASATRSGTDVLPEHSPDEQSNLSRSVHNSGDLPVVAGTNENQSSSQKVEYDLSDTRKGSHQDSVEAVEPVRL